ncbi:MAG: toxin [Elusimicrobia bacterium]|nr:toxin [Elusimicrobiota bacterium]
MGIRWDPAKSRRLRATRGAGFEEILGFRLLELRRHPGRANQDILLFEHEGYVWVVPFVTRGDEVFLKTAFRSRRYTRRWRAGELP